MKTDLIDGENNENKLIAVYEEEKKQPVYGFKHIITTVDDKEQVIKQFDNFNNQGVVGYEIVEFDLNEIIEFTTRRGETHDFFNSLEDMMIEKGLVIGHVANIDEALKSILMMGRGYKTIAYIKCDRIEDIYRLPKELEDYIALECIAVDRNNVYKVDDLYKNEEGMFFLPLKRKPLNERR